LAHVHLIKVLFTHLGCSYFEIFDSTRIQFDGYHLQIVVTSQSLKKNNWAQLFVYKQVNAQPDQNKFELKHCLIC
jgi:hypothetical protein